MVPGPFKILHHFRPVFHFLKLQLFYRSPGDNEAIVVFVLDIVKFQVAAFQVGIVRMGAHPAYRPAEVHFQLQGGITQKAQQL